MAKTIEELQLELAPQSSHLVLSTLALRTKVWWVCDRGHEWDTTISIRKGGSGCPYCSNSRVKRGYNSIHDTDPELASQLVDQSLVITRGASKKVEWRCDEGHQWFASAYARAKAGCPTCGIETQRISRKANAWSKNPFVMPEGIESVGEMPKVSAYSTTVKFPVRCKTCGHEWEGRADQLTNGHGCTRCGDAKASEQKTVTAFNRNPFILPKGYLWDGEPEEVSANSAKTVNLICPEGHKWPTLARVVTEGSRCRECSFSLRGRSYAESRQKVNPLILDEGYELVDPEITVSAGVMTKVMIRCPEGHETSVSPWHYTVGARCVVCTGVGSSRGERELAEYVKSIATHEVLTNYRGLIHNPDTGFAFELDIYIPELNLAIEYNGVYTHSTSMKSNTYHKVKRELCEAEGVRLLQVWECDWNDSRTRAVWEDKIKYLIRPDLRLPTVSKHKCDIALVDATAAREFIDRTHLQGANFDNTQYLALVFEGEIVSVAGFRPARKSTDATWELARYASTRTVVGGMSKLVNAWGKSGDVFVSYADLDVSDQGLYLKNGWKPEEVQVASFYATGFTRKHKRYTDTSYMNLVYNSGRVRFLKTVK